MLPPDNGADGAAAARQEPRGRERRRRAARRQQGRDRRTSASRSRPARRSASSGRARRASRRSRAPSSASGRRRAARIRLDGAALDQWSTEALGQHIGYLPQDVELFAGTVAQNIARFDAEAPIRDDVIAAAQGRRRARADPAPAGRLRHRRSAKAARRFRPASASASRWRARSIGDPFLVVLDEPNSNLDAEGDEALTQAILGVRARGGIVVVVAHRPSALAGVDLVLVMTTARAQAVRPEGRSSGARCSGRSSRAAGCSRAAASRSAEELGLRLIETKRGPDIAQTCAARSGAIIAGHRRGVGGAGRRHRRLGRDHRIRRRGDRARASSSSIPTSRRCSTRPAASSASCACATAIRCKAGDVVIRLDDTADPRQPRDRHQGAGRARGAPGAREEAERDGERQRQLPRTICSRARTIRTSPPSISGETQAVRDPPQDARRPESRSSASASPSREEEIRGLEAQVASKDKQIEWISRSWKACAELWSKNLVQFTPRHLAGARQARGSKASAGQLIASIAQSKGKIAETELQILQIDQDMRTEVGKDLADIRGKTAELVEKQVAAEDQLKRIDIRAPQDGMVHQLAVHTVGGVISAGEQIMLIVPEADKLIVEAKVQPQDIDQVRIGQAGVLRFPPSTAHDARDQRRSHPGLGRRHEDQRTGVSYYTVRIACRRKSSRGSASSSSCPACRSRSSSRRRAHRDVLSGQAAARPVQPSFPRAVIHLHSGSARSPPERPPERTRGPRRAGNE